MLPKDPMQNVLYIDLTSRSYEIRNRSDLIEKWLGGTGLAIQLLKENVPPQIDPLQPENAIILTTGPLVGAFPMASKAVAMFKSPLTGNLGESHAGGRCATAIRTAGYGAIVIKGKSEMPVYLVVDEGKVMFRDGRVLWGMPSSRNPRWAIAKREPGSGSRTILVMGPGGEKLVRYASVMSETFRHFGRMGLGAVFGSKQLKAIQIGGRQSFQVKNSAEYRKLYKKIFDLCLTPELVAKYRELGTAENILPLNEIGGIPTRNLTQNRFEAAEMISGEHLQQNYLSRRIACTNCPVACIHLASLKEKYAKEPFFAKTSFVSYDYELLYAFGSMLGVTQTEDVLKLLTAVEDLGIDAISTGVSLAWATEATLKGLISEKETGIKLSWGDTKSFLYGINAIIDQANEFYQDLARGASYAATKYGGQEFAIAFGGNEMPGYHTGPTAALGFLYGTRHSHLDSGPYSFDQKMFQKKQNPDPETIAQYIVTEESWRQILTSLVVCLFARKVYDPKIVTTSLETMGFSFSEEDLTKIGEQIYAEKNRYKINAGFNLDSIKPPARIFETPTPLGKINPDIFEQARKILVAKIKALL